ncbi:MULTISPECIES: DeoR/GlpR family DNA-binding transcription regulator [Eubacteriales]|uniref:DeoR/GlpR family DNA-binding transcription regulator n=1 Tax=Eubacteriales TaxID=186802 RepID=UPI00026F20E5|nr:MULTISPECIES: DeoR/GlpR family DNA-binding transcription regulator [Eubacteriales]EJF40828.1 transcriptional regulator, DeoR family [Clostridium sp. MSTE9]
MLRDQRMQFIMDELKANASVTVTELSAQLQVSEVTVRKLLADMEKEDLLRRTWGGAVSLSGSLRERSYQEKETLHVLEKQAIAQAAYDCIKDGEAIFLDTGTTTIELAKLIVEGPKRHIMVCTNAINIAMEMTRVQDIEVIVVGGELRPSIHSCVGSTTENSLKKMFFDKGFITGDHFTVERGYSTPSLRESELKRVALAASKEKFILMDYSKYGNDSLMQIVPAGEIDVLVTDWHMSDAVAQHFEEQGISVLRGQPQAAVK